MNAYWYYTVAVLFVLLNVCALAANLFTLPGNWIIVGLTVLFALFVHLPSGAGISLWSAGVVVALALLGELIEVVAGAAGAAQSGGSRRGVVLCVVGAVLRRIASASVRFFFPTSPGWPLTRP